MACSFLLPTIYTWITISLLCWCLSFLSPTTDQFRAFLKHNAFHTPNHSRKLIVATLANQAYIPLVELFVRRLSALQLERYIVFCVDPYIYEYCILHHIPAWLWTDLPTSLVSDYSFWQNIFRNIHPHRAYLAGNIEFNSLTQLKYLLFYCVISYNFDLLFSDPDVLWIQDPIPWLLLQQQPATRVDILIQTDRKYSHQSLFSSMNTGFVYIQSNCATQLLLRVMMQQIYQQPYPVVSQQRSFNRVLCRTGPRWYSKRITTNTCLTFLDPDNIFLSCIGVEPQEPLHIAAQVVTQVLDPQLFPHGAHFHSESAWNTKREDISSSRDVDIFRSMMILHYNWMRGVANKTQRISRALEWQPLTWR